MKRFTMELTSSAADDLDKLADALNITKTELMRRALSLIKVAIRETVDGKKLVIVDSNNKIEKEVILR